MHLPTPMSHVVGSGPGPGPEPGPEPGPGSAKQVPGPLPGGGIILFGKRTIFLGARLFGVSLRPPGSVLGMGTCAYACIRVESVGTWEAE